ncbi:MAG: PH domain-containing protein [Clostridia bacterium]|nr:PH domain-containing protein [Clostridia bacterium]
MSRYVENHLYENELIVEVARRDKWSLVGKWILGILFCWLLLIPLILAIKASVAYAHTELVLTNKRLVRKSGNVRRRAIDVPLNKILNVYVETTFWGRVFNANKIRVTTALGVIVDKVRDADAFKGAILSQIDLFEEARLARQASWTAQAMAQNTPKKRIAKA